MAERDPLDDLRRAWREVRPPGPDAPADDAAADPATRAALAWMRAVWDAVEGPAAGREVPLALRARQRGRAATAAPGARAPRWVAAAAGVAAAVLAATVLWRGAPATGVERVDRGELAAAASAEDPGQLAPRQDVPGPGVSGPRAHRPGAPGERAAADEPAGHPIAALEPDRMELRSGPVRLVLVTRTTQDR